MKARRNTAGGFTSFIPAVLLVIGLFVSCSVRTGIADFQLNDIPPLADSGNAPVNVILIIGDGMGPEHVRAGGMWINGDEGTLTFEDSGVFSVAVPIGTRNAFGGVTDSAASATAMAAGDKSDNGVLSVDIPGDGSPLRTIAEMARDSGKSIGLVTTASVYDATVAAFAVHHDSRNDYAAIDDKMLDFRPEVLFGGGKDLTGGISPGVTTAESDAYAHILETADELEMHDLSLFPVFGRFGDDIMPYASERPSGLPGLDDMARKALDVLDADPEGFFLVIENELTDEASHLNDIVKLVEEIDALDQTVDAVLFWLGSRTDTLVIVTADHETGGLTVQPGTGRGIIPTVSWTTSGHTAREVMLYCLGPDSETFLLARENVDIFRIASRYYE